MEPPYRRPSRSDNHMGALGGSGVSFSLGSRDATRGGHGGLVARRGPARRRKGLDDSEEREPLSLPFISALCGCWPDIVDGMRRGPPGSLGRPEESEEGEWTMPPLSQPRMSSPNPNLIGQAGFDERPRPMRALMRPPESKEGDIAMPPPSHPCIISRPNWSPRPISCNLALCSSILVVRLRVSCFPERPNEAITSLSLASAAPRAAS
mmetsp:Transcript_61932/g.179609  ORF Transcript_61932/g.179609 Transcript_61932/m.179609 type:complete len:208 (-) Transcript_61932:1171-1794(-)